MTSITIIIPGEAVPYARTGGNGRIRFTPTKQRHAMARARDLAAAAMGGRSPLAGSLGLTALLSYVAPKSWSKKKAAETYWKSTRPDSSNLIKLIEDAFNSVVWKDDAQIASLHVEKIYGPLSQVLVTVRELDAVIPSTGLRQAGGATEGGSGESPASSFPNLIGMAQPS